MLDQFEVLLDGTRENADEDEAVGLDGDDLRDGGVGLFVATMMNMPRWRVRGRSRSLIRVCVRPSPSVRR